MPKTLIVTHYWSNECDVTGTSSHREEQSIVHIEPSAIGASVFPDSNTEWLHGAVKLLTITPEQIQIATTAETFTIKTNEIYHTSIYTKDGNHRWWYTFQIKDL